MPPGDCVDSVGNNHIIIVFEQMTVIMELNPWMEVKLCKVKSM